MDRAAARAAPTEPPPALDAQMLRYLEYARVEKRLAARTLALYTLDLHKLTRFAAAARLPPLQLQSVHLRHFIAQMHSSGRSARGIALIVSGWRGFFAWAARQGLIAHAPLQGLRTPRAGKPLPKALGVDEAMQFAAFSDAGAAPWFEARDAAMVEMLYGCGLRVGELAGLDALPGVEAQQLGRGWVDLQAGEAHVQGKGGKRRSVPVGRYALAALRAWLALRELPFAGAAAARLGPALFVGRRGVRLTTQSIWLRLRLRSQSAAMRSPVHPHMLRHSFASHVLQGSGDLRAVQELLGHASITSTQVYTRLDFEHLSLVYDAAHPRAHKKPPPA